MNHNAADASVVVAPERALIQVSPYASAPSGVAAVVTAASSTRDRAEKLACELGVPCVDAADAAPFTDELVLWWDAIRISIDGLSLCSGLISLI